jgi:hypothetical protein
MLSPGSEQLPLEAQSVTEFTSNERTFLGVRWRGRAPDDKIHLTESDQSSMRVVIVAVAAAYLSWGVATAQTGPSLAPPPPPVGSPQAPPPSTAADIWSHMTPQQRKQLWQQLTPQERANIWQRLPPEQRKSIRDRLTPEERQSIRERWLGPGQAGPEQRAAPAPGPRLSPEERRRLREEIRQAHPELRRGRGGGRP